MRIIPNPKFQAFDDNGDPLVGGKLYTYKIGTTTAKTTYSDNGTTANANPVIFDSRGEATVYGEGGFKFVLKDSADVTVWTQDNIDIDYESRIIYPESYGAVGDGTTDDTAAITAMIADLSNNTTVKFTKASYLIDDLTTIDGFTNLKFEGMCYTTLLSAGASVYANPGHPDLRAFKFENCSHIKVKGFNFDREGSTVSAALTNGLLFNDCDYVKVECCYFSDCNQGVVFSEGCTYAHIKDCLFTNPKDYSAGNLASNYLMTNGIIFGDATVDYGYSSHCLVENCWAVGSGVGIFAYASGFTTDVEVAHCHAVSNYDSSIYARGGRVNFHDNFVYMAGKDCIKVIGGTGLVADELLSWDVRICDNIIYGTGIVTGGACVDINATNAVCSGNVIKLAPTADGPEYNIGIALAGNKISCIGNNIYLAQTGTWANTSGVWITPKYIACSDITIASNLINGPGRGVIIYDTAASPEAVDNIVIDNNQILNSTFGIYQSDAVTNLIMTNNKFDNAATTVFYAASACVGPVFNNNIIRQCKAGYTTVWNCDNVTDAIFNNNQIELAGLASALFSNGSGATFQSRKGNQLKAVDTGIVHEMDVSFLQSKGTCADGTTAGKAKTTTTILGFTGIGTVTKTATDDLWDLTAVTTDGTHYKKVLLTIYGATPTAKILEGAAATTQALAPMPKICTHVPTTGLNASLVVAGYVELGISYAGGDLATNLFDDLMGHYPF